jgi:signal transduction histidine kinase
VRDWARAGGYHRLLPALVSSSDPADPHNGRDLLRAVAEATATTTGDAFFRQLTRQLAQAFAAEVAFVAELLGDEHERARVLAVSHNGAELREGLEFSVKGTPCELVLERELVSLPEGTCARFPNDRFTVRNRLDGYLAVVMRGTDGQRLGYIGVQSTRRLEPDADERAALAIFSARAGAEIERRRHEAELNAREAEVAASRVRIVEAADEERRRIGRNLHDGAQQRLVALGHLIAMAERKLEESPETAAALLAQSREQAALAGDELRELVRGLHPAGLVEHGLGHALAALATRSPLPLHVDAMPERRLPGPIETTIYYLVSEAITNALKHAGASAVRVEVRLLGQRLLAAVSDDGCGGASASPGGGLAGLADRVNAVGGTLRVESPPGKGTRLEATITMAPWRSAREPFFEFGHPDDGGMGEQLLKMVLDGRKTVTLALAREWDLEGGPPRPGARIPVLDASGAKRAIVEVERVTVVPFSDVDHDALIASQVGDFEDVEAWRASQRAFYEGCRDEVALLLGEPGWRLTDDEPMVVTWFTRVE